MNGSEKGLLIVTNGARAGLAALEYGVWLAGLLGVPVTLLGIIEQSRRAEAVKQALYDIGARLEMAGIPHQTHIVTGKFHEEICRYAQPEEHLVVFGRLGLPLWQRWLRGRSFRHIAREICAPLIYVPAPRTTLNRILLCMGGLSYASSAEHWALYLAHRGGAQLTILHVVEPVQYHYPTADRVHEHWTELLETNTPQARHLRRALEDAQEAGVPAALKVRHGDVVHEIVAEVHEGDYDLVGMGSPRSSHNLRHMFMPNVTAEVAETISLPVLTATLEQDLIFG